MVCLMKLYSARRGSIGEANRAENELKEAREHHFQMQY